MARRARLGRGDVVVDHHAAGARLDGDDAHRVRHDVVELPGDADALLDDGVPGQLDLRGLEVDGSLTVESRELAPPPGAVAERPGR